MDYIFSTGSFLCFIFKLSFTYKNFFWAMDQYFNSMCTKACKMLGTWHIVCFLFLVLTFKRQWTKIFICMSCPLMGIPTNKELFSYKKFLPYRRAQDVCFSQRSQCKHLYHRGKMNKCFMPIKCCFYISVSCCVSSTEHNKPFPAITKLETGSKIASWTKHVARHVALRADSFHTMWKQAQFSRGPVIGSLDCFRVQKSFHTSPNISKPQGKVKTSSENRFLKGSLDG